MSAAVVRRVPTREAVADWLGHYEPLVLLAMAHGHVGQHADDILTHIQTGRMQLWATEDRKGMAITEIQDYPRFRQLLVFMVAGENARDWLAEGHVQLEAFAKSQHCKYMIFHGRPGWEPAVRKFGYDAKQIIMRKDLSDERRKSAAINHEN